MILLKVLVALIVSRILVEGLCRQKSIIVVGGGAAGYFSAIQAANTLKFLNIDAEVFFKTADC